MTTSKKNVSAPSPLPMPEGYWAISNAQVPHLFKVLTTPSLRRKALFRDTETGATTPIIGVMNEHFTFEAGSGSDRYVIHGYTKEGRSVQLCVNPNATEEACAGIVLIKVTIKTKTTDWFIHPMGVVQIIVPYRA